MQHAKDALVTLNMSGDTKIDSWYESTAETATSYPRLEGEISADVGVIGAGYTGLSTAIHLAERGYRVGLLEAEHIGWGASGRNGGLICSGQRVDMLAIERLVPKEDARRLWHLAEEAKGLVRKMINQHNISCHLRSGILEAAWKQSHYQFLSHYIKHLRTQYDYREARLLDSREIRNHLDTSRYHGGYLDHGAGHLHPLKFALGLGRAATDAGVSIYHRSKVNSIRRVGGQSVMQTDHGQLITPIVVLACNGYLGNLEPRLTGAIMPINNFMLATESLGKDRARSLIRNHVAVSDTKFVVDYFRMSPDYRLLFGGGENYTPRFPADIKSFVRRYMLRVFPQLSEVRIDYAWGGTLAITRSRFPLFGRLEGDTYYALGYSGQGVALATLAGQVLSDAIAGSVEDFDVFAKLPRRQFPGGALLRWPSLAFGMMYYALRDQL
jgi:gamma-glutamylputrescine oxidase